VVLMGGGRAGAGKAGYSGPKGYPGRGLAFS